MSKNRRLKRSDKEARHACVTNQYFVIDADGQRRSVSPLGYALLLASHWILPITRKRADGTIETLPVARIRPGYRIDGNGHVRAIHKPEPSAHIKSNFMVLFWRSFIFADEGNGRRTLGELLRAIAEDHQQARVPVTYRRALLGANEGMQARIRAAAA